MFLAFGFQNILFATIFVAFVYTFYVAAIFLITTQFVHIVLIISETAMRTHVDFFAFDLETCRSLPTNFENIKL